jgi:hypothetical protein
MQLTKKFKLSFKICVQGKFFFKVVNKNARETFPGICPSKSIPLLNQQVQQRDDKTAKRLNMWQMPHVF